MPGAVYIELVTLLFSPLLPIIIIGIAVLWIGTLIAIRKSDVVIVALTLCAVLITIARVRLILAFHRQRAASPLTVDEARGWERLYAIGSFSLAAVIGILNARSLMIPHPQQPMLVPLLITGLMFGYASGLVTRVSRPRIPVISLALSVLPTVIGFITRTLGGDGLYVTAVFFTETVLIGSFAIASLVTVSNLYNTTLQQLVIKMDLAAVVGRDDQTGLANRMQFRARFNEAAARIRENGALLAVLCLDLDKFKAVNDTYGHPTGDLLLQAVTKRLVRTLQAGDTVARFGGDEFAVLQNGIRHADEARLLAHRIIRVISAPYNFVENQQINIGVSIGIALAPRDGRDLERLLLRADAALYQAKRGGRGTVIICGELLPLVPAPPPVADTHAG